MDEICFLEEELWDQGREEGRKAAPTAQAGAPYHLGFHAGLDVSFQIGYYLGTALHHLQLHSNSSKETNVYNEKTIKLLCQLKTMCLEFPRVNTSQDIDALLSDVRVQYRKLCSLLKIEPYNGDAEANAVSF